MFTVLTTTAKIIDYTDSYFIAITDGKSAIYDDYKSIVHETNLTEYEEIVDENYRLINDLTDQREIQIIRQQTMEIERILDSLKIERRQTRSLDILGSALKFIAGTPDHEDIELIISKQDLLADNNDRQITVNSMFQERINELSTRINALQDRQSTTNKIDEDKLILLEAMTVRNMETIAYLDNLALSIILATKNIINPVILDNLNQEHIFNSALVPLSINNILQSSNISIFQKQDVIYFLIKIPFIKQYCNFLQVNPVIHNNVIVKVSTQHAAKCDGTIIPVSNCMDIGNGKICKKTNDPCLKQLLNNNSASCPTESADHVPKVVIISNGMVILNNVAPTLVNEGNNITVKGTLLVTFSKNVTINGTEYQSSGITGHNLQPHPPKKLDLEKTTHDVKISLPYLERLNTVNLDKIGKIRKEILSHRTLIIALVIFIIILIIFFKTKCAARKIPESNIEEIILAISNRSRDVPNLKEGGVSTAPASSTPNNKP